MFMCMFMFILSVLLLSVLVLLRQQCCVHGCNCVSQG
jgi:hypothetical protein